MKYAIFALSFLLLFACTSDETPITDYSAENDQQIIEYIAKHNLNASKSSSGLYYVIDEVGTGDKITATSDISVKFKGSLIDGTVFENTEGEIVSFNLQGLIQGWVEGLQLFNHGGKGTLLIPAHLGFGNSTKENIPAGSVLIFEIEIIDYKVLNDEQIEAYINEHEITNVLRSESGLYYQIEELGTGEYPSGTADVTVVYKGYFMDGEVFDESSPNGVFFNLSQVIPGWTEGIQYFKQGGKGKLFVPSHLGYGIYDYNGIPGGSVLIFEVELVDFID
ncbi:FKBP-type peptidyl-prolyl cis-trans isomerase [Urechidicola vernalis]|uniref:Peptidyl-prolyl cis-trans isomerase n=1 Tax=Urechidicola vernalis TaxID=3075600 RepID=A0ABU2YAH5_9FLAO|nr:FKBP-type peptidyl-prolyl cis-trans isomerase [Urechidicola sp. P050]MDT0554068.1 FKBP-type peptidyl-prolyl cis-trans isomerase [Urechidicola sp. P050]